MGGSFGIIIISFLLAPLVSCQGLHLSMERTLGLPVCGRLICSNLAHPDENIFSTTSINVYDVTQAGAILKLASVTGNGEVLNINPAKVNDISGTGSVTRYEAHISLNFSNETDCLYGNFRCEVEFVNIQGLADKINENTGPGNFNNGSSCCTALTYQLSKLTARLDEAERELSGLRLTQTGLEQTVAWLIQQNGILEAKLDTLSTQITNTQNTVTPTKAPPAATTAQVITGLGACNKWEAHTSPRALFLLWDKVPALCDTETDGGGWVIIQRRTKGDIDFYRFWDDYKKGFGTTDTDYWLGLDVIHNLTAQGYNELRIDMELYGVKYFAHYPIFNVDNEILNYKLTVTGYSGSAGDSLSYHNLMMFTTSDRDHDKDYHNCATVHTSAWWYNSCYKVNLNGIWGKNDDGGVIWHGIEKEKSLTFTEIKVRRI